MTREALSRQPKGVIILLTPEAQVPDWILNTGGAFLDVKDVQGRSQRFLKVSKGDAGFIGGGQVDLRIGRQRVHRVAFEPDMVLEIQTSDGELIKRNHHMCVDCGANTGRMVNSKPSKEIFGSMDATFQCKRDSTHTWELKHI